MLKSEIFLGFIWKISVGYNHNFVLQVFAHVKSETNSKLDNSSSGKLRIQEILAGQCGTSNVLRILYTVTYAIEVKIK